MNPGLDTMLRRNSANAFLNRRVRRDTGPVQHEIDRGGLQCPVDHKETPKEVLV
jgi:hypothetical protein